MSTGVAPPEPLALERLDQLAPLARGVARRWAGQWGDRNGVGVDDLVQEVILALWRTLQKRPSASVALLARAADHAAYDALLRGSSVDRPLPGRRRRAWGLVRLDALMEDGVGWEAAEGSLVRWRRHGELPAPTEELALARVLYQELCRQLTPQQRQVLDLRLAGCSEPEISRLLAFVPSRTHMTIVAIRRKLMTLLADGVSLATTTEAARELGLSRAQVARLCRQGKIPGARQDGTGKRWLIPQPVRRVGRPRLPEVMP